MNRIPMSHLWAVLALAGSSLCSAARAQSPKQPEPPTQPEPVSVAPSQDDAQREMIELFGKVERELRAIDRLLQEASRAPSAATGGSLADQLRNAQSSGESVRKDIDRILELAAQQPPSSSGSSPSSGQPQSGQGENPMDRQGEQSTGREATPSAPEPGGEKPQPGGDEPRPGAQKKPGDEKPGGSQPKPGQDGREQPDGPQGSKSDPDQKPGSDPAAGAVGPPSASSDARDRWGDLPFHAREVFRNEGGRDMPPLYREWIDAYYKRLNKQP
jgi:translation initiation factor IF-2